MPQAAIDSRKVYSLTEFLRNYKVHIAQLKESRTPEVLTVNGRAEVVMLDTESYESMVRDLNTMKEVAELRAHMARALRNAAPQAPVSEDEMRRREEAMRELVAETERLGLYR